MPFPFATHSDEMVGFPLAVAVGVRIRARRTYRRSTRQIICFPGELSTRGQQVSASLTSSSKKLAFPHFHRARFHLDPHVDILVLVLVCRRAFVKMVAAAVCP